MASCTFRPRNPRECTFIACGGLMRGRTYAYRVLARGNGSESSYSNTDVATTAAYSPVAAGTTISVPTFDKMLDAVNSARAAAGLSAVSWSNILSPSDPIPVSGAAISARSVTACRARMAEALLAVGAAPRYYTDPDPTRQRIKAAHVNEILEQLR